MKKILPILLFVFIIFNISGQTKTIDCKEILKNLKNEYTKFDSEHKELLQHFNKLKSNLTPQNNEKTGVDFNKNTIEIRKVTDSLNFIYNKISNYKDVCKDLGVENDTINKWLKQNKPPSNFKEENKKENITYTYFGKNQVLKENFIDNTTTEGRILNNALTEVNKESYFGDITIPQENQKFSFVIKNSNKKNKSDEKYIKSDKKYRFKKIQIEIKDGMFADTKVYVEYGGNIHIFENLIGNSFLRYASFANDQTLEYKQTIKNNDTFILSEMRKNLIRLGDIMVYDYSIGNNYIPHDLKIELPAKNDKNQITNKQGATTYQIKQKTSLDKIIELRAYTDFLALLGESDNGILQIEGTAKFYIFPFSHRVANGMQLQMINSISPYIQYARFEKDNRFIKVASGQIKNNLELVEKRFLNMGINLNLLKIYHKKYPASANFYGIWGYNLSEVQVDDGTFKNIKASNLGIGFNLNFKRFNNFGFDYKTDFSWFDYKSFNNFSFLPNTIPVFRNQAEVFYFPTDSPNQSIFLKLSTYNYIGSQNKQSFYQLQFGYKFSIGSRTVRK